METIFELTQLITGLGALLTVVLKLIEGGILLYQERRRKNGSRCDSSDSGTGSDS